MVKMKNAGILLVFLVMLVYSPLSHSQSECVIYIFGFKESLNVKILLEYFSGLDHKVVLYDLNESSFRDKFLEIVETIRLMGVSVIPPEICISCELSHFSWNEVLIASNSPLIGFFRNGRLVAVTLGTTKPEVLEEALNAENNSVEVFSQDDEYFINDEKIRNKLEKLFLGDDEALVNPSKIITSIALLALADSVNPCVFAVFTAMLFITLHSLGKIKAALTGLSFISAVFVCYYVLGLGAMPILLKIPYVDRAIALIGAALGIFNIVQGLKTGFKSPIPKTVKRFLEFQIRRLYVSPAASFLLGAVASFTLLPCSGGPYVVGLSLLSILNDKFQAYLLLALYNALFIAPLLAILLITLASRRYVRKIKALKGDGARSMELISGSILLMICVYLLLSPS